MDLWPGHRPDMAPQCKKAGSCFDHHPAKAWANDHPILQSTNLFTQTKQKYANFYYLSAVLCKRMA